MAFDVIFNPDAGIGVLPGVMFIGDIGSARGANGPRCVRFLWGGFCFLLRFGILRDLR